MSSSSESSFFFPGNSENRDRVGQWSRGVTAQTVVGSDSSVVGPRIRRAYPSASVPAFGTFGDNSGPPPPARRVASSTEVQGSHHKVHVVPSFEVQANAAPLRGGGFVRMEHPRNSRPASLMLAGREAVRPPRARRDSVHDQSCHDAHRGGYNSPPFIVDSFSRTGAQRELHRDKLSPANSALPTYAESEVMADRIRKEHQGKNIRMVGDTGAEHHVDVDKVFRDEQPRPVEDGAGVQEGGYVDGGIDSNTLVAVHSQLRRDKGLRSLVLPADSVSNASFHTHHSDTRSRSSHSTTPTTVSLTDSTVDRLADRLGSLGYSGANVVRHGVRMVCDDAATAARKPVHRNRPATRTEELSAAAQLIFGADHARVNHRGRMTLTRKVRRMAPVAE